MPNVPYAGAYEVAYGEPRSPNAGLAYAGYYSGLGPDYVPPPGPAYDVSPMDRAGDPALVAADNPQPPGAALYVDGFIVNTYI